jgi:hypothetical protein
VFLVIGNSFNKQVNKYAPAFRERICLIRHLFIQGRAYMKEPVNLKERYFPDKPGAAIGAFTASERLVVCGTRYFA